VITNTTNDAKNERVSEERKSGRHALSVARLVIAVVVVTVALTFAAGAGRFLVIDAPEKSDVILVLAGETDRRLERGLQLLDQGYGRTLVIDVPADARIYGFTAVDLARKYVDSLAQRQAVRICSIHGLSTKEESREAGQCLESKKAERVLLVTSDFHTRRARRIFRHEIKNKVFSVAAAYDTTQFGPSWWKDRQWAKTCVDEWLRLVWWTAVDRWR